MSNLQGVIWGDNATDTGSNIVATSSQVTHDTNPLITYVNSTTYTGSGYMFLSGIQANDLLQRPSGVRAQAVSEKGDLLDDFLFEEGTQSLHVLNAPSPAATASLAIGEYIASKVLS